MQKRRIILITLIFLLAYSSLSSLFAGGLLEAPELLPPADKTAAEKGVLDLRNHDFENSKIIDLNGEWEFYWKEFISPGSEPSSKQYMNSNQLWSKDDRFPHHGYASYRLTILLPEKRRAEPLLLQYRELGTAARILWNGREVAATGRPSQSKTFAIPKWESGTSELLEYSQRVELIIYISNYDNISGGIIDSLLLGKPDSITHFFHSTIAMNFLIIGILLIMSFYHLYLFFFRKSDPAPFWFAMTTLFLALRALVVDTFPISLLYPDILLAPVITLNYLSFAGPMFTISMFVYFSYKSRLGKFLCWLSGIGTLAYASIILATAPITFTSMLFYFQIFALVIAFGLGVSVLAAVILRKPLSGTFGFGFLILLGTAVFDIIKAIYLIPFPSLSSFGMVLFVFILSLNLSRRTSHALDESEKMAGKLKTVNLAMERFVPREFLRFLKKSEITEVNLGDHSQENLTILFADLRDFTNMAEESNPRDVFNLLNTFLAEMGEPIRNNSGFVDKYLGDGIMALFPENSSTAIQAAIEMQQKLDQLNLARAERIQQPLVMGIGIHTGECMLGTIGEDQRMDGTVISDAVNVSARLQNLTRNFNSKILVSEDALSHAEAHEKFYHRNIGLIKVKGRRKAVTVIEIINADHPDTWKQKRGTRRDFQKAMFLINEGRHSDARDLLLECRLKAPEDSAVDYYLKQLKLPGRRQKKDAR